MSDRRNYVVYIISELISGTKSEQIQTAEQIVDRLNEEGLLHLGYGNADIDNVVACFSEAFGTTKTKPADRWAAARLVNKHTTQAVTGVIKLLSSHRDEPYCPTVNTISQLEEKWPGVIAFLRRQGSDSEIIQV